VVVVGLAARPSAGDVEAALASGDAGRARVVLGALREHASGGELDDLEDRVVLAEAGRQLGQERLKLLDRVANRKGAAAAEAAAAARSERLSQVRGFVKANDAKAALASLDAWFRGDTSAEVSEERARAHEAALARCSIDACRFAEAALANTARTSSARAAQADSLRTRALDALALERIDAKAPALARLQQLRALKQTGLQTLEIVADDAEVKARASAAIAFAETERAKVPLLRADLDVIQELLGAVGATETGAPKIDLQGAHAHLALDAAKKCTGIYVVGPASSNRAVRSEAWPADRLVSQAVGKTVKVKAPAEPTTTAHWYESGYAMTARWRLGELVELRIGDATP
jgi:hypothetical protein